MKFVESSKPVELISRLNRYISVVRRFSLPLTFSLWVIAVLSRVLFNGPILGFDYSIYQPDGANYTFRTLAFLADAPLEAANRVSDWYAIHGYKHNIIDPVMLLPENSPVWNLSAPRILYPLLSIPFVALLGIPGMLVVPALALLGVLLINHEIGKSVNRPELGLLLNIIVISSSSILRWFVANLTDGLLAFFVGLVILVEIRVRKISLWIGLIVAIVALASATRFSAPIFLSLGLSFLILKQSAKGFTLLLSGFCGALPLVFFDSTSAVLPGAEEHSLLSKFLDLPVQSAKVLIVETGQLIVLDRAFFFMVMISLFMVVQLRGKIGVLTIGVLVGVLAIGFINGTLGVNFRYQLPLVPFICWGAIQYLYSISLRLTR